MAALPSYVFGFVMVERFKPLKDYFALQRLYISNFWGLHFMINSRKLRVMRYFVTTICGQRIKTLFQMIIANFIAC